MIDEPEPPYDDEEAERSEKRTLLSLTKGGHLFMMTFDIPMGSRSLADMMRGFNENNAAVEAELTSKGIGGEYVTQAVSFFAYDVCERLAKARGVDVHELMVELGHEYTQELEQLKH